MSVAMCAAVALTTAPARPHLKKSGGMGGDTPLGSGFIFSKAISQASRHAAGGGVSVLGAAPSVGRSVGWRWGEKRNARSPHRAAAFTYDEEGLQERGYERSFFPPVGVADDPTVANPLLRQQMLSTEWFGCVFQLEGVLVKSRFKEHKMSWKRLAEEREDSEPPEMVLKLADLMKPEDFISRHLRWTRDPMEMRRIKTRRDEIYAEILAEDPDGGALALLDGVLPFLTLLQNNKVPMAVTCNTYSYSALCEVLASLQILDFFQHDRAPGAALDAPRGEPHVVSAEDVSDWLPDPLPIERACQLMGRPPKRTIVFGNNTTVTEACFEAQAKCVLLLGRQKRYEMMGADTVVDKLTDLTVSNLKRLFTEETSDAAEPQRQVDIFPPGAGPNTRTLTMEAPEEGTDTDDAGGKEPPDSTRRRRRRDV
mmetsp:Transcript_17244/g.27718  ORF Transcript_17244/g.27718 Transcript_17244/m.27718 type:complete len:425 (-) Transcript_17244:502-1776(-)